MSLGNTLRAAREARGITTSELAARTHMLVQIVEGLENEDFRRIPAPIYGRGFIKLYCEAVDLDPKPLQAEFMELFSRPKEMPAKTDPFPARSVRPDPAPPPVVPPPVAPSPVAPPPVATPEPVMPPAPAADTSVQSGETENDATSITGPGPSFRGETPAETEAPPKNDLGDLFAQPAAPETSRPLQPPPKRSYGDLFEQAYAEDSAPAKPSAAEKFRTTMSNVSSGVFANVQKLPPNTGRIAAVSALAVLVLSFIVWGISALYEATTPAEAESAADAHVAAEASVPEKRGTASKAAAPEKPDAGTVKPAKKSGTAKPAPTAAPEDLKPSGIDIPAIYID